MDRGQWAVGSTVYPNRSVTAVCWPTEDGGPPMQRPRPRSTSRATCGDRRPRQQPHTGADTGHLGTFAQPRIAVVVEDDAALRDLLREVLEDAGYWVLAVGSPPELADVRRLQPDLLVLDLILEGWPLGWKYLQALRVTAGAEHVPVLACTGHLDLARRAGARLGDLADTVLLKPFGLDDLVLAADGCARARSRNGFDAGLAASP